MCLNSTKSNALVGKQASGQCAYLVDSPGSEEWRSDEDGELLLNGTAERKSSPGGFQFAIYKYKYI